MLLAWESDFASVSSASLSLNYLSAIQQSNRQAEMLCNQTNMNKTTVNKFHKVERFHLEVVTVFYLRMDITSLCDVRRFTNPKERKKEGRVRWIENAILLLKALLLYVSQYILVISTTVVCFFTGLNTIRPPLKQLEYYSLQACLFNFNVKKLFNDVAIVTRVTLKAYPHKFTYPYIYAIQWYTFTGIIFGCLTLNLGT